MQNVKKIIVKVLKNG